MALKDFAKAHEIDPLFFPPISNLIRFHLQLGHQDQAQEYHEKHKTLISEGKNINRPANYSLALYTGDFSNAYITAKKTKDAVALGTVGRYLKNRDLAYANSSVPSMLSLAAFRDFERMKEEHVALAATGPGAGKINRIYQHLIQQEEGAPVQIFDLTKDMDRSFDGLLFGPFPESAMAIDLIGPWREAGKKAEAMALAHQLRAYIAEMEERGYEPGLDRARAALSVFDGDYDGAMEILERMVRRHKFYWWYDWLPCFANLHDRDDFQRLVDDYYKYLNAERAELGWEPATRTVLE